MSFVNDVKAELEERIPPQRHCRLSELAGMLLYGGNVGKNGKDELYLVFSAEKENIAKKCFTFLKKSFNMNNSVTESTEKVGRKTNYQVRIDGTDDVKKVTEKTGFVWPSKSDEVVAALSEWEWKCPQNDCCVRSFVRGLFLMSGMMNDPEKSYHYEITVPNEAVGGYLKKALERFGCEPKLWERRGSLVVYMKDASQIADALTIMDATKARVHFEDIRVVRSKRGEIQRQVNCEIHNLAKTSEASRKQIEDIRTIQETIGFGALPEELEKMARVRIRFPEASLQELGTHMVPPLGRSGVNHRLQKLCNIAEGIRLKEGG